MKIGLVRRGYSPTGGAEAYVRRFADASATAGHECVLFTGAQWPANEWPGTIVRVDGNDPRAFADKLRALQPREHCEFLLSLERVWECDAYRAGDGVHAAWLERRGRYESPWKQFARRFNRKHTALLTLESNLFAKQGAGRVIANSKMVQAEIVAQFGYPKERISVIYNGIPPMPAAPEDRDSIRKELGLTDADYVLLFAGSGWERKGLRFAIESVNQAGLPKPMLLVAGRGNVRSMPHSDRVRYLGPRSDIPRLLAAADLFILPTIYEPFSNACLEALAAGLPVITTRFNGFAEVIEHGRDGAILEEPSDVGAITRAIGEWASSEKREAIRPRLMELGARFSIEENVRQTLAVL